MAAAVHGGEGSSAPAAAQAGVKPKNTGAAATTMHQMPKARQPMRAGSRRLNDPRLAYEDEDKDGRYRKRVVPLPEP